MSDNNQALKEGYLEDYISGGQVPATPEEIEAVQVFARQLVEDYGYSKDQIQTRPLKYAVNEEQKQESQELLDAVKKRLKEG